MFSKFFLSILIMQICYYIVSVAMQYSKTNFKEMLMATLFYAFGLASVLLKLHYFCLICLTIALVLFYKCRKEQGYIFLNCLKGFIFSLLAMISLKFSEAIFYILSMPAWFYIAQVINGILLRYFIRHYLGDENKVGSKES